MHVRCVSRKLVRTLAQGGLSPPPPGALRGPSGFGAVLLEIAGIFRKISKIVSRCRISCLIVCRHYHHPILTQFGSAIILMFAKSLILWKFCSNSSGLCGDFTPLRNLCGRHNSPPFSQLVSRLRFRVAGAANRPASRPRSSRPVPVQLRSPIFMILTY